MGISFGSTRINGVMLDGAASKDDPVEDVSITNAKENYERCKAIIEWGTALLSAKVDADTNCYMGIRYNTSFDTSETFTLSETYYKIETSDGSTYTYSSNGSSVSHAWDTSKGITVGTQSLRYVIVYSTSSSIHTNNEILDQAKSCNAFYIFNCNSNHLTWGDATPITCGCKYVEGLEFINGYTLGVWDSNVFSTCEKIAWVPENTTWGSNELQGSRFCDSCYLLYKLPSSLAGVKLTSNAYRFLEYCHSLSEIPELDFTAVTNMQCMFRDCFCIAKLPDSFTCASNTSMNYFCYDCYKLAELPSDMDTSECTDFSYAFGKCTMLTAIPAFDTSSGTNFRQFITETNVKTLPALDVSNGTSFQEFCKGCYNLTSIASGMDFSKGTTFQSFLQDCHKLAELPDMDCSSGTNFSSFCYNDVSLVKTGYLKTPNATNMNSFMYNTRIRYLPEQLDVSNVYDFTSFCYSCLMLQEIPDSIAIGSTASSMKYFCSTCSSLKYVSKNIVAGSCKNFNQAFIWCESLQSVPLNLSLASATDVWGMFKGCYSLSLNESQLIDLTTATSTGDLFYGCDALTYIKIILPSSTNLAISTCTSLTVPAMRWIADNAPTISSTLTLTLGSTNIAKANAADSTIITTLQNKGWTVA